MPDRLVPIYAGSGGSGPWTLWSGDPSQPDNPMVPIQGLYICPQCASVVMDQKSHSGWHSTITKKIRRAK